MRAVFVALIVTAALFGGALLTQLLSYVLLHPYGLHTLTYGQAFSIDLVLCVIAAISGALTGLVKGILE